MNNIPEWIQNASVKDCKSIEEFAQKYRRYDRFTGRGEEYAEAIMRSHREDIENFGYTAISRHESILAKFTTFIV